MTDALCGWQDATGTVERHASASAGDAELDAGRCAISPPRRSKPADERLCAHAAIAARADFEHAAVMRGDAWLRHVRAISARVVVAGLTLVWLGQVGKGPHDRKGDLVAEFMPEPSPPDVFAVRAGLTAWARRPLLAGVAASASCAGLTRFPSPQVCCTGGAGGAARTARAAAVTGVTRIAREAYTG